MQEISNSVNELAPIKEKIIPIKWFYAKWFNEKILEAFKKRDKKYKEAIGSRISDTWKNFKEHRNWVVSLIRDRKREYLKKNIDRYKGNSYKFWKTIKADILKSDKNTDYRVGVQINRIKYENDINNMIMMIKYKND